MNRNDRHAVNVSGLVDPQILRVVGEATYQWQLGSDVIVWSDNAGEVMGGVAPEAIATGRAFAQRADAEGGHTRFEAVTRSGQRDDGAGIGYHVEYAFRHSDSGASGIIDRT